MAIAPGVEPHMVALANQADAANRPRWIIAFALICAIGCAAVCAAGTMRLMGARSRYASTEAQLIQADALANQIIATRADKPSLSELYPPAGLMYNQVQAALESTWQVDRTGFATFATIQPLKEESLSIPGLGKANVTCTIRNQPLEKIMAFIETTLGKSSMRHAFVSTFELEPTSGGWNAEIEFRRYQVTNR
ncbi:MAG: hypothetical protein KDA20_06890 [Phycisphaerales bacterium]|nr:hypothetical protein [Phycisphaerales bacterium]